MKSSTSSDSTVADIKPDFSGKPSPISEWATREDFPRCALGAFVDIQGFKGVVVEIIGRSFRIVSPDGVKQRFNGDRLRTLLAPPKKTKAAPKRKSRAKAPVAEVEAPVRVHITDPDFTVPAAAIGDYASQSDFPKCAYGKHVEMPGYTGVVVEIVKDSVRIQSAGGSIRRFNGAALKRLYGTA